MEVVVIVVTLLDITSLLKQVITLHHTLTDHKTTLHVDKVLQLVGLDKVVLEHITSQQKLITTGQIRQVLMVLTKHCQVEMDSHTGILVEDTELVVTGT